MSHVRIKICGLTSPDDVRLVADLGGDAIGLNFYSQSPRFITPAQGATLIRAVPPFIDTVGVFVELKTRHACALAFQLGLGAIQCFADREDLVDPFPFRRIVAVRIRDVASLAEVDRYLSECRAVNLLPAAILVDAHVDGKLGGTGKTAPWELLRDYRPGVPVILAGGLTPDNVGEAIRIVRPYGVDVASGVESSPGRKDPVKLRRFIEAVRRESTQ